MSQEKVREILSHVDMTKIDLSSFKISEKKFNELSHLYRNRVVLSCIGAIINKDGWTQEETDHAFALLKKVVDDPNVYDYTTIYSNERKAVDDAIDDITTRRDRSINDVKLKAIEKRMKDAYKQMRKTIEAALENGNAFEYEFDEATVERCIRIANDAIKDGLKKAEESDLNASCAETSQQSEQDVPKQSTDECVEVANVQCEAAKPAKIPFWKKMFGKKEKARV